MPRNTTNPATTFRGRGENDFTTPVRKALAERAGYICSNPNCGARTIGPSPIDPMKSIYSGEAAHITAASPGGARYDASLTIQERSSIENAIHLCASCAGIIDKNDGIDFPTLVLRQWKIEHEKRISVEHKTSPLTAPSNLAISAYTAIEIALVLEDGIRNAQSVLVDDETPPNIIKKVNSLLDSMLRQSTSGTVKANMDVEDADTEVAQSVFASLTQDESDEIFQRPPYMKIFVASCLRNGILQSERGGAMDAIEAFGPARAWLWERDGNGGATGPCIESLCLGQARTSDGLVLILYDELTPVAHREFREAQTAFVPCYVLLKEGATLTEEAFSFVESQRKKGGGTLNFRNVSELQTHVTRLLHEQCVLGSRVSAVIERRQKPSRVVQSKKH